MNNNQKRDDQARPRLLAGVDLDGLFEQIGLSDLTVDQKEEYVKKLEIILENRIFDSIYDSLTPEQGEELDSVDADNIDAFLKKCGVNLDEIAVRETLAVREHLVKNMAYAQGIVDAKLDESVG